jgi:hypothetical protein
MEESRAIKLSMQASTRSVGQLRTGRTSESMGDILAIEPRGLAEHLRDILSRVRPGNEPLR